MERFPERIFKSRVNTDFRNPRLTAVRNFERIMNMKNQSTNSVIPAGELRCVWMDAGVAEFKLCNQELRCETCAFDMQVTRQNREMTNPHVQQQTKHSDDGRALTADDIFYSILKKRLTHLDTLQIPQDRIYSRGQFWIQQQEAGNYRVGINHILANFLQPILSIVISKSPANIHRHDPFCWIILPGGAITLRSPIEATMTQFNPALRQKPNLLCTDPFYDGWIMDIKTKSKGLSGFSSSTDSQQMVKRTLNNVEQLFQQTFQHLQPSAGTTLFDGGISMGTLESILDPTIYRDVVNRITHFPS
jgi:glycine cleavage system H lipoate-binding protein